MALRDNLGILKQLIHDTFRQAVASGICWMMLVITAICVVFCLSVSVSGDVSLQSDGEPVVFSCPRRRPRQVLLDLLRPGSARPLPLPDPDLAKREGVETIRGRMTLAFGAISIPIEPAAERRGPFPPVHSGERCRWHFWAHADAGMDRGFPAELPRPECGVGSAHQTHCALAITAR